MPPTSVNADLTQTPPQTTDIGAELRARLARELRDGFVSRAVALPLGSQETLARVAYLCRLQGSTRAEIARAAAADASFAAALLRISNSAASAGRYPITNLPAAVTRLGTRMVRMLAVTAPTLRLLAAEDDGLVTVRREIHRHSIRVGVLARELAPPSIYAETALAAGLVHNVGLGRALALRQGGASSDDRARDTRAAVRRHRAGRVRVHARGAGRAARPGLEVPGRARHRDRRARPGDAVDAARRARRRGRSPRPQNGVGIEPPCEVGVRLARRAGLDLDRARDEGSGTCCSTARSGRAPRRTREDGFSGADLIRAFDNLELAA